MKQHGKALEDLEVCMAGLHSLLMTAIEVMTAWYESVVAMSGLETIIGSKHSNVCR